MLKSIIHKHTKKEWLFLCGVSLVVLVLTNVPYIYLLLHRPADFVYGFTTYINPADNFVYYGYIKQALEGAWLFENVYSVETGVLAFKPFWLILGKLAWLFQLEPWTIFHAARIVLSLSMAYVFYRIICYFVAAQAQRMFSLAALLLTAGLGWLYIMTHPLFWLQNKWSNVPFDFLVPSAFPFFAMTISPHFIMSWLLLIGGLYLLHRALFDNRVSLAAAAGLCFLFLFLMHPFYVPLVFVLGLLLWLKNVQTHNTLHNSGFFKLCLAGGMGLPPVLYYSYLLQVDWTVQVKTMQNFLPSPGLLVSVYSYGLAWALALIGIYVVRRQLNKFLAKRLFLLSAWALLGWGFIYAPVLWQRRLAQGWYFALVVLASFAIFSFHTYAKKKWPAWSQWQYFVYVPLGLMFCLSNFTMIGQNVYYQGHDNSYFYYSSDLNHVAKWLQQNTASQEAFITNDQTAFVVLPALSGRKTYFGHLVETVYSHAKYNQLVWFFTSNDEDQKKQVFLTDSRLDYIVYNQADSEINGFLPDEKEYLTPVYKSGSYTVYKNY
jgi:hypothetical protein